MTRSKPSRNKRCPVMGCGVLRSQWKGSGHWYRLPDANVFTLQVDPALVEDAASDSICSACYSRHWNLRIGLAGRTRVRPSTAEGVLSLLQAQRSPASAPSLAERKEAQQSSQEEKDSEEQQRKRQRCAVYVAAPVDIAVTGLRGGGQTAREAKQHMRARAQKLSEDLGLQAAMMESFGDEAPLLPPISQHVPPPPSPAAAAPSTASAQSCVSTLSPQRAVLPVAADCGCPATLPSVPSPFSVSGWLTAVERQLLAALRLPTSDWLPQSGSDRGPLLLASRAVHKSLFALEEAALNIYGSQLK